MRIEVVTGKLVCTIVYIGLVTFATWLLRRPPKKRVEQGSDEVGRMFLWHRQRVARNAEILKGGPNWRAVRHLQTLAQTKRILLQSIERVWDVATRQKTTPRRPHIECTRLFHDGARPRRPAPSAAAAAAAGSIASSLAKRLNLN